MKLRGVQALAEGRYLLGEDGIASKWFDTPEEAVNDLFARDCGGELPARLAEDWRPVRMAVHAVDVDAWTDPAEEDGA